MKLQAQFKGAKERAAFLRNAKAWSASEEGSDHASIVLALAQALLRGTAPWNTGPQIPDTKGQTKGTNLPDLNLDSDVDGCYLCDMWCWENDVDGCYLFTVWLIEWWVDRVTG